MAGVEGTDVGEVELLDAGVIHEQYLAALEKGPASIRALVDALTLVGAEIVELTGGAAVNASGTRWEKLRVRYLILSSVVAASRVLTIGTRNFTFDLPASLPVVIPFPLVIERGTDVSFSGDGRCYLIGDPE